jgi:hypothetical protein
LAFSSDVEGPKHRSFITFSQIVCKELSSMSCAFARSLFDNNKSVFVLGTQASKVSFHSLEAISVRCIVTFILPRLIVCAVEDIGSKVIWKEVPIGIDDPRKFCMVGDGGGVDFIVKHQGILGREVCKRFHELMHFMVARLLHGGAEKGAEDNHSAVPVVLGRRDDLVSISVVDLGEGDYLVRRFKRTTFH